VWDLDHPELADWKAAKTPPDNGWRPDRAKTSAWSFVVSEAVFFLLLLVTYVVFNTRHSGDGPTAATALNMPRTGVFTLFLLASSLTFWFAERSLRAGKQSRFLVWLGLTIVLGIVFLSGQAWEYAGLLANNITIDSNLFASTFFTVTGFHGLHVTGGLVALAIMLALGWKSLLDSRRVDVFGAIGVYWHFVDGVWIAVFAIIYLRFLQ
jgi:heme/copper-type cytochrome/quinol oxidase subunit 3